MAGALDLAMKGALRGCDGGGLPPAISAKKDWRESQRGVVFQSGAGGKNEGTALTVELWRRSP